MTKPPSARSLSSTTARPRVARRVAGGALCAVFAVAGLAGCSSEVPCGEGGTAPGEASIHVISGARLGDPAIACIGFPDDATAQEIQAEIDHYKEFAQAADSTQTQQQDQMGRGYVIDVTVADQTIQMEEYSVNQGRWFWKKDVYYVSPVTSGD